MSDEPSMLRGTARELDIDRHCVPPLPFIHCANRDDLYDLSRRDFRAILTVLQANHEDHRK